jgi:hypothetical protein
MAKKTNVQFKAAIALAVADLNDAFEDDTTPNVMANDFRDARHPLRNLNKLFDMDSDGQLSANDDFIDAVYNGDAPQEANGLKKQLPKF